MGAITNTPECLTVTMSPEEILGKGIVDEPVTVGQAIQNVAWHIANQFGRKYINAKFAYGITSVVDGKYVCKFYREPYSTPKSPVQKSEQM